jgi:hypothetical protein
MLLLIPERHDDERRRHEQLFGSCIDAVDAVHDFGRT